MKTVDANFKQIMSLGRPLDLGDETTTQLDRSTGGIIFVVLYLLLFITRGSFLTTVM
jgi:hypothetical protein